MTLMTDLVGIVRNQIRDDGTPQAFPDVVDLTLPTPSVVPNNSPELSQFVTDALAEYSRYRPLRKPYVLSIVLGQTTYTLPTDWIGADLEEFDRALRPDARRLDDESWGYGVPWESYGGDPSMIISPAVDRPRLPDFRWYDDAHLLVLASPPLVNYTLPLFSYFALHTPATLPAQWQYAALMPAYEKALRALATDQSVKLQNYKIKNEIAVDNRQIAKNLMDLADVWRREFHREVVMRPFGSMG